MERPMPSFILGVHLSILWALALCIETNAQQPTTAEPSQVLKRFEKRPKPRVTPLERSRLFSLPARPPRMLEEAPSFVLKEVVLEGVTVYDKSVFEPYYAMLVGKSVTLADLYRLAEKITARYREDGYMLSFAVIPRQRIQNGVVKVQVLEGCISGLKLRGPEARKRRLLLELAKKAARECPTRAQTLERYLLLMNDLPGVSARAVFSPSRTVVGGSDMEVIIDEKRREGGFRVDNRGTRYNGPIQFHLGLGLSSVFRDFDRTYLQAVTTADTRELQLLSLEHEEVLNSEGTRLRVLGVLSTQEPGYLLNRVDTESESTKLEFGVRHPFLRSRRLNVTGRIVFSAFNIETKQLEQVVSRENLRSLRLGLTVDWLDRLRGVNLVDIEMSQGLNILGARRTGAAHLSRPRGKSNYSKVVLYASRQQQLFGRWGLDLRAMGQYSFTRVLASEEFSYGGIPFGRAHDPSEVTGDHGVAGSLELHYTYPVGLSWVDRWQVYAYGNAGYIWRRHPDFRGSYDTASDAGIGMRVFFDNLRWAEIEIAKPLSYGVQARRRNHAHDVRVFFSITAQL